MIVITTHLNADFDCLASMAAAHKLYPDAIILFPGSQEQSVRNYLEKTDIQLPIRKLKHFDFSQIKKLVVVDTTSKSRLGPLAKLCDDPKVEVEVFDHHPSSSADIKFDKAVIEPRGANSTLMLEILLEKDIPISPDEATLLMLGIYEDTGSLTFTSTVKEDFKAAEKLLGLGANLTVVSEFLQKNLNREQVALLNDLLDRLEYQTINGVEVVIAVGSTPRYVGDISMVAHAIKDAENLGAIFLLVETDGGINFIARSRISAVNAGEIAERLGGGGHPTAASASIKDELIDKVKAKLLKALKETIPPAPTAKELMVSPVISVAPSDSVEEAEKILTRHSFNAVPVVKGTP